MSRQKNRDKEENSFAVKRVNIGGETRRGFGRFISGLAAAGNSSLGAAVMGGALGGEITSSMDDIKKSFLNNCENQGLVSEWLFGEDISKPLAEKKFILSNNNPYSKVLGASSHTVALMNDLRRALRIVDEVGVPPDFISTDSLNGHVMLLGGPVANIYARQYLGWGEYSPILSLAGAETKYSFANCLVKTDSTGYKPPFQLINPTGDRLTDRPGKDYLLLSSFPNVHSENFSEGDRLIIASGMHGGGTRAFGNLLSQPRMLSKIPKWSQDGIGWQVLIEAELDERLMPTGNIEVHQPHFIEADYRKLHKMLSGAPFYIDKNDPFLEGCEKLDDVNLNVSRI